MAAMIAKRERLNCNTGQSKQITLNSWPATKKRIPMIVHCGNKRAKSENKGNAKQLLARKKNPSMRRKLSKDFEFLEDEKIPKAKRHCNGIAKTAILDEEELDEWEEEAIVFMNMKDRRKSRNFDSVMVERRPKEITRKISDHLVTSLSDSSSFSSSSSSGSPVSHLESDFSSTDRCKKNKVKVFYFFLVR